MLGSQDLCHCPLVEKAVDRKFVYGVSTRRRQYLRNIIRKAHQAMPLILTLDFQERPVFGLLLQVLTPCWGPGSSVCEDYTTGQQTLWLI